MATLKEAVGNLKEAIGDLSSLHVQTFTGTLEMDVNSNRSYTNIETAIAEAKTSGKIKLASESLYKFDGDSYNFISSEDATSDLLDLHKTSVENGIKTRQGLIEMAKDALGL